MNIDPGPSRRLSPCKSLGQFDEQASIGRILDFLKCNDQAQTLDNAQIDLMILKQPQQFIAGMIGIVRAHSKGSRSE
jgi:hypothetical protein